jgi:hypothetical protein
VTDDDTNSLDWNNTPLYRTRIEGLPEQQALPETLLLQSLKLATSTSELLTTTFKPHELDFHLQML